MVQIDSRQRTTVVIASPLEMEQVNRINALDHRRLRVLFRPDLLPTRRYVADHTGPSDWARTEGQQAEWEAIMLQADVLWDLPRGAQRSILDLCPNLKWVQTTSAGVGPQVKEMGLEHSEVIVTTASGVHAGPLTEFVFAMLLFHTKQIGNLQKWQQEKTWTRFYSAELRDQTLAIVGPGRIGGEVARIGKAFGMKVLGVGTRMDKARDRSPDFDEYVTRDGLQSTLARADAVVLSCPITPETIGMIGRPQIATMKPGVVLINIARGAVVDEEAMIEAIDRGHIAFAGLDVFQTEPLPSESPLWSMPNVIINPHSASTVVSENRRVADIFIANLERFLDGRCEDMTPLLDKSRGY
ncbi:D-2-hydroxyacid dehydrogenase [soil metagenome]